MLSKKLHLGDSKRPFVTNDTYNAVTPDWDHQLVSSVHGSLTYQADDLNQVC